MQKKYAQYVEICRNMQIYAKTLALSAKYATQNMQNMQSNVQIMQKSIF